MDARRPEVTAAADDAVGPPARRLRRAGRRAGGTIIRRVRRERERVKPEHVASERRTSTGEQALVHERGARGPPR